MNERLSIFVMQLVAWLGQLEPKPLTITLLALAIIALMTIGIKLGFLPSSPGPYHLHPPR